MRNDRRHYNLVIGLAALVGTLGCGSTPKFDFNLAGLPIADMHEEPIPSLEEARAARRVLVLPFADRTNAQQAGRLHNALDDLIRRDLMLLPELSVFPNNALPVSVAMLSDEGYRAVDTAVRAGKRIGATHVVIGEVAARGEQVAIEVDVVDVAAAAIVSESRFQQPAKKIDKVLPQLRAEVAAYFHEDMAALEETVPGYTPPHDVLEHCGFGDNRFASGDYSQALIDFYAAAKRKKPYAGAYVGIAETQLLLGGLDLADRAFGVALTHDPDLVEAYWRYSVMRIRVRGGGREALALSQRASRRAPLFGPAHLTLGTLWFVEKQYAHADRHFQVAAILLPNSIWPVYNHAHVQQVQGDLAGARASLEHAAALAPQEARVQFDLGLLLKELGEPRAALARFRIAADIDTQNPLFLYHVAELLEQLGHTKKALAAYQASAAFPFSHEWLHRRLAEAFLRMQRLPEAERTLAAGYADGVRDPEHVLLYASVLLQRGQANRLRRRDYSSRARNLLAPLADATMTADQRARADALAETVAQMQAY